MLADVQHAFLFFENVSPFGARVVVTLRERLRFLPPRSMTVALWAAHVRRRAIGFHCRVIFSIGEAFGRTMVCVFPRITGLEREIFCNNRAPSRGMSINQRTQHAWKIFAERLSQYFREVLASPVG